jgi:hypothetical protein
MKKLFVLSTMCILTMLFTNSAMSQVVASGTTGACTWELTGTSGNYTLTISGSGAMGNYNSGSAAPWFSYGDDITTLDLQQGVTTIGNFAFFNCYDVTSVTIPNSITTIGTYVFEYCVSLTSVSIPNLVTSIGERAFSYCVSLTSVTIPNSVTTIGNGVFNECSGLTSITIPNSVTTIGTGAFGGCIGLTSVTIPNSVTSIGIAAFSGCIGLTSVTIPNSVTSIRDRAFYGCSGLTSVTIPNSVTTIGDMVFYLCSGLTSIDVDASNPNYSSVNGVLFNKLQNTLRQYPSGKIGDYTIPNSVTTIGYAAFASCIGLTSITIPNSVTSIRYYAFDGCSGLTELHVKAQTPPALEFDVFSHVSATIPVHVPCGKASTYQSASGWNSFSNYIDDLPMPNLTVESNDVTMGTATIIQSNSCTDNTAIIEAVANEGYLFVQWNDGNTQNPRTITVTQDITYTAIFDTETGIPIVGTGHALSLPQIYPNPANNELRIKNYALQEGDRIELYNMLGHPQSSIVNAPLSIINVSHLANGVYMLRIVSDNKVICAEKVVIAR